NMPSITAEEAPLLKPFIKLADVLGAFVGQVTDEPIKEIEILYDGVTAGLKINGNLHSPLLCVDNVFKVASGNLSLPGKVMPAK
ncbi:hypothetical protein SB777_34855, partial [Burkholderia sp. SIMBA_052]